MNRKLWLTCISLALLAFAAAFAACGDDDDDDGGATNTPAATTAAGDEAADLAAIVERLANTSGAEATADDIDFYLAHVTDSFLQEFGTESVEACQADPETCIGDPLPGARVSANDIEINGNEAKAKISSDFGLFGLTLAKQGGGWKATGTYVPDDEIPGGVEVIDFEMAEFAFPSDLDSDAVASGQFALRAVNIGQQPHEIVLVELPEEGAIEDLLQDETFQPQPLVVKATYKPGDESDVAIPALEPGRYAFVCFLPDTEDAEGTPHVFKGMTREFSVQ